MTLGTSLGQIFPDNHCGLSTVYTTVKRTMSTNLPLMYSVFALAETVLSLFVLGLRKAKILGGLGKVSPVLVSFDLVRGRAMDKSL